MVTLEDLAVDPRSIDAVYQLQVDKTCDVDLINSQLVVLLAAELPVDRVEAAIRIAKKCCARAVDRG